MTSNDTENKMYVVDSAPSTDDVYTEALKNLTEKDLEQLYEENKDAIDLMGGLDMFESLMALSDEDFEQLKPAFIQLYKETLEEKATRQEILAMIASENYNNIRLETDFAIMMEALDAIDFLSEPKISFLKEITIMSINKIREYIGEADSIVKIPCELAEGISIPTYAHESDAGMDIYSPREYIIGPGETVIIPTGIKVAIPAGYAILIQPRSGQSVKTKLRIANTPGLIDSGYRDEIGVIIENIEPPFKDIDYEFDDKGEIHIKSILHGESYTISEGQRFAQMRLVQVPKANFIEVTSVGEIGEDRNGGFGSTGLE